jgi:hypothetical protein
MKTKFFVLLLFATCISCKKDKYFELDKEFKSYFGGYKDGSWWVYEDTLANSKDSIYITDYNEKRESYSKNSNDYYEFVDYKLHSGGKINWIFLHKNSTIGELTENLSCYSSQKVNLEIDYFAKIPFICKENGIYYINDSSGLAIIENYFLHSLSYNNVIKVWNQSDTFYFAKDIGLIHYKLANNDFILMDYYINYK